MPLDPIAVDANVLVYALYRDAPQHAASRAFLARAQRGDLTLCFTSRGGTNLHVPPSGL